MIIRQITLLCLASVSLAEVFTSTDQFSEVIEAERKLTESLRRYIAAEEERLGLLKEAAAQHERMSALAASDPDAFVGNPVNMFLLVKELARSPDITQFLSDEDSISRSIEEELELLKKNLPDEDDLRGAARALMRLQDTYKIEAADLAAGHLPGSNTTTPLTALDCFEIGRVAYNSEDYKHTITWMLEADHLNSLIIDTLPADLRIDRVLLLDFLAYSQFMTNDLEAALRSTNEMLLLDPNHSRGVGNQKQFMRMIAERRVKNRGDRGDVEEVKSEEADYKSSPEFKRYEALCRGEGLKTYELWCDYATNDDPRLLIAPVKREIKLLKPLIMIYYDIISPSQTDKLKNLAVPLLDRATVHDPATGKLTFAEYRITKNAWLTDFADDDVMPAILHRVSAVTQLNMETVEELQMANYGIGGQYEPHFDFARRRETGAFEARKGNRIATLLFYLTNVQAGGSTVFVDQGLKLEPVKGAAAFWFNLQKSSEGDESTRHAACPVLVGNKWVANKWFHERGQELWHPCGLHEDDHFTMADVRYNKRRAYWGREVPPSDDIYTGLGPGMVGAAGQPIY